jgi:phasin family protein
MERLTETQIAATSAYMSGSVKQLQALAGTKDLQTAVNSQSQYINGLNESIVDNSKTVAGILTEARDDFTKWVETGMKVAMESPVAKAAKK